MVGGDRVGSADILLGLERLAETDRLRGAIYAIGNTPYASGAALIEAP